MADEMMGIEKLRRASTQTKFNDCRICEASGIEIDCDEKYCNDERGRSLAAIADQIEREQAEELAAAKRDLTDEAREAVERLHAVSHDDILRSANPEHEIVDELCKAVGVVRQPTYTGTFDAISDRLIELIERGGKRDVDAAALRKLADAPERIRKAVESAPKPDAESDAERACAALLDWRDQVAGLLGIDGGSMADEVQDAIMAELDKRLMPPGMEWPRWDDSKPISHYDTLEDATAICLALDGSCYSLHYDMPDGERVCLFDGSERIKRPEPEVLGADGEPIRKGETVHLDDEHAGMAGNAGEGFSLLGIDPGCDVTVNWIFDGKARLVEYGASCPASWLAHTPPDYQQRIDEDKRKTHAAYWGCDTNITCNDCPAVIDGMKPYEYYGVLNCMVAQGMDIARRKHALDAKTMGGE